MSTPPTENDHPELTGRNEVVACFADPKRARVALQHLTELGVDRESVGVLLADGPEARLLLEEEAGSPTEGAKIGSVVGGSLWGLGAVALATNPIGVLAVGPLVALMGGAAAGAAVGGLLGGLVGLGIPQHEATLRMEEIQNGGVVLTVPLPAGGDELSRESLLSSLHDDQATAVFGV